MSIETGTIVVVGLGIAFLIVGLLALRAAGRRLRKSWVLVSTSESDIASLSPGTVAAITGTVVHRSEERVSGSFVDENGVLVGTSLQLYDADEDAGSDWDTFHDSIDTVPFAVDDGTGEVTVEAPVADHYPGDVDLTGGVDIDRSKILSRGGEESPAGAEEYAASHDVERDITSAGEQYRVKQGVLSEGEEVYVLGQTERGDDGVTISGPVDVTAFALSTDGKPSVLAQLFSPDSSAPSA